MRYIALFSFRVDSALCLFHSDSSGTITFKEFKNVFSANIGPDSIPFDFDWYVNSMLLTPHLLICVSVTGSSSTSAKRTALMC